MAGDAGTLSEELGLGAGCHLWWVRLSGDVRAKTLSAEEQRRAAAFVSEPARRRFVVARMALRQLCAEYAGGTPEGIRFAYGMAGKPRIEGSELEFNVAHCEDFAVIAFARGQAVGVDVERVRALPEMDEVAPVFMQAAELAAFRRLEGAEREWFFFRLWTRREAYAKLTGAGLAAVLEAAEEPRCWFYEDEVVPGSVAVIAMERQPASVVVREFRGMEGQRQTATAS